MKPSAALLDFQPPCLCKDAMMAPPSIRIMPEVNNWTVETFDIEGCNTKAINPEII